MRHMRQARFGRQARRTGVQSGQAMVEMALIITVLLVLAFGTVDAGLYMYRYVQAANCTREAARRAAVRDNPASIPYCVSADLAPSVSYSAGGAPGSNVTASLSITHQWIIIGHLVPGIGSTIPINSHTTMRMEGQRV